VASLREVRLRSIAEAALAIDRAWIGLGRSIATLGMTLAVDGRVLAERVDDTAVDVVPDALEALLKFFVTALRVLDVARTVVDLEFNECVASLENGWRPAPIEGAVPGRLLSTAPGLRTPGGAEMTRKVTGSMQRGGGNLEKRSWRVIGRFSPLPDKDTLRCIGSLRQLCRFETASTKG